MMTEGCLLERMSRTTYALSTGFGDLRDRIPAAYVDGFGTISESEVAEISFDLAQLFKSIAARLRTDQSDEELARLAKDIMDFDAMIRDAITYRKVAS